MRSDSRAALPSLLAALWLAACATVPPPPVPSTPRAAEPSPPPAARPRDGAVDAAADRHRELARRLEDSGDLAGAAVHWDIVLLLAPGNDTARQRREALRATRAHAAAESLAEARTAQRAGQPDRALQAYLRVLAMDPSNTEAMRAARELDRQRYARIQQERANRAGAESNATVARMPSPDANGDSYNIEQALAMLAAGDLASGVRDLKAWVAANPRQTAARRRIAQAVYDKARELESGGARIAAADLLDSAVALRGEAVPEWTARARELRRGGSGAAPR